MEAAGLIRATEATRTGFIGTVEATGTVETGAAAGLMEVTGATRTVNANNANATMKTGRS